MQIISSECRQLILSYPSRLALTSPGIISGDYSHAQCQKKICLKSYADSEAPDQTVYSHSLIRVFAIPLRITGQRLAAGNVMRIKTITLLCMCSVFIQIDCTLV